jgi:hypothetical protein
MMAVFAIGWLAAGIYFVIRAPTLAARPRKGTAWHPSVTGWRMLGGGFILAAVLAAIDVVT